MTDFRFTGWGGKFAASRDDCLIGGLFARDLFSAAEHRRVDWALEGGAIETDGAGTLLTTWRCLHQRHPEQSREQMSAFLRENLAPNACSGSNTAICRATIPTRISIRWRVSRQTMRSCSRPATTQPIRTTPSLRAWRRTGGAAHARWQAYRLYALPWARPILDDGRRLAASYANYLVVNGAVLVPAYGDPADAEAARIIGAAHPGREVIARTLSPLIWQNGSLHCMTMQLPRGLLA